MVLNDLHLRHKDHPEFQLISFARKNAEDAGRCIRKFNIQHPACPVSDEESRGLSIDLGFPAKIIIDSQGKIVLIKTGGPTQNMQKKEILDLEEKITGLFTK